MTDNMMPELTLTPDDTATAAAVEVPSLTLTPEAPEVPKEEEKKIEPVEMDDKLLTEEEKKAVEEFSHKIDIRDTNQVLQYGAAAQKSVASFSENALNNVRGKDMGEIGEDLSRLVVELTASGRELVAGAGGITTGSFVEPPLTPAQHAALREALVTLLRQGPGPL